MADHFVFILKIRELERFADSGDKIYGKSVLGSVSDNRILQKLSCRDFSYGGILIDFFKSCAYSCDIHLGGIYEEINILRRPQKTVEDDCIAANQHVFHFVAFKRRKQLQEFVKDVHPGSTEREKDTKSGTGKKGRHGKTGGETQDEGGWRREEEEDARAYISVAQ